MCTPQNNTEKSRLSRICTYHFRGVTDLCKDITRLYTIQYIAQSMYVD
jgi:hypothetical protein